MSYGIGTILFFSSNASDTSSMTFSENPPEFRRQNDQYGGRGSQGLFNASIPAIPRGYFELVNPQAYAHGSEILRQSEDKILVSSTIAEKQSLHLPAYQQTGDPTR